MDSVFPRATRTYVPFGLAVSPSGNVYVTGTTAAMQRDADEVLTIKYDTDGNLLWSRTESGLSLVVGFTGISAISGIALDGQENVFVASNEESIGFFDAAVWKYDKDGHTVPGGFGLPGHIDVLQVDRQGNTYILGGVIPDNPNGSAFSLIRKTNAAGHLVWEYDSASGPFTDLAPDINGNLYVANFGVGVLGKLDGNGVLLWSASATDSPVALAVNAIDDVYQAGSQSVTKYSGAGLKLWTQPFTGSAAAMTIGGDGALLVTGSATAATGSGNDWITTNYIQDAAKLTPATLSFGNELLGKQSASQTVTLTNTGERDLIIKSIPVACDFHLTNNCPSTLAAGASCKLGVTFTPTELGARTGTLSVLDDWEGSDHNPQIVKLSGTGVAP